MSDAVLPADAKDAFEAAHVENVEFAFLSAVCGPSFATIQQCAQDTCLVDS